jgi:hypothetical protein
VRNAEYAKEAAGLSTTNYLVVGKLICVVFILTPIGKGDNLFTECVVGCKDSVITSCTLWNGLEDECGLLLVLRLICITKLSYITSAWRRLLGFGCLMLILFIKQSPTSSKLQKMVSNKKSKRRTWKRRLSHKMLWWRVDYASTLLSLCILTFLGSKEDLCAKPDNKMNHVVLSRSAAEKESVWCSQQFLSVIMGGQHLTLMRGTLRLLLTTNHRSWASLVSWWVVSQYKEFSDKHHKVWFVNVIIWCYWICYLSTIFW